MSRSGMGTDQITAPWNRFRIVAAVQHELLTLGHGLQVKPIAVPGPAVGTVMVAERGSSRPRLKPGRDAPDRPILTFGRQPEPVGPSLQATSGSDPLAAIELQTIGGHVDRVATPGEPSCVNDVGMVGEPAGDVAGIAVGHADHGADLQPAEDGVETGGTGYEAPTSCMGLRMPEPPEKEKEVTYADTAIG